MFFHIDESGNTGNNLFDAVQPTLSYGVLSSKLNVDALGRAAHAAMLRKLGVFSLHANQLGTGGLLEIAPELIALQRRFRFRFDYYYIHKPAYALVILFDAIFDAGLNKAVKWEMYWTPMRFLAIHNLSQLCDEALLKIAWQLCISKSVEERSGEIVALLTDLRKRNKKSRLDNRTKELFDAAFGYGIEHPQELDFGVSDQKMISPNAVGFQFVLSSIARRLRAGKRKDALSIKVDRQTEFNPAQVGTHYAQKRISEGLASIEGQERRMYLEHPLYDGLGDEETLRKGMPKKEIEVDSSEASIGLQIVDVYLWLINRGQSKSEPPSELQFLAHHFLKHSCFDSISMEGMAVRWNAFEKKLPAFDELTDEQLATVDQSITRHRRKVDGLGL